METLPDYREDWLAAFRHDRPPGESPRPTGLMAREARGGRTVDLGGSSAPPPILDDRALLVAYDAPATLGCFLSLGWPLPPNVLDLEAEFRCHVSGLNESGDWGLDRALNFYGARGPGTDPSALEALLRRMLPVIDLERALLRGRYTTAVARMERVGIPIDRVLLTRLRASWGAKGLPD